MKIELTNVKHSPSLSEETEAFTANFTVNGHRAGSVSNRGHGGPNDVHWLDGYNGPTAQVFHDYLKTLAPEMYNGKPLPMTEDYFFSTLIEAWLKEKDAAKMKKRLEKAAAKERAAGRSLLVGRDGRVTTWIGVTEQDMEAWKTKILVKNPGCTFEVIK